MTQLIELLQPYVIAAFLFVTASCATSPTGRKQAKLMPASQMDSMGVSSFAELKKKTPISTDKTMTAQVKCVVTTLLNRNGFNASEWEVQVFKDDSVNAFALPGKKIGVHTGIFKAAKNQDQLAAVLGHEIGHVIAEHGNERVSENLIVQGAMIGASLVVDGQTQKGQTIMALIGAGANFGILLPFSRTHELEADHIGVLYMSKAGFNPVEARNLWINMSKVGGGSTPEFMSTHPSSGSRISQIDELTPEGQKLRAVALQQYSAPKCY